MALSSLRQGLVLLLAMTTSALQITPGSSCSSMCGDSSTTDTSDIVCNDFDYYSSAAGSTFMNCIECLQTSHTTTDSEDDVAWFLYNLRYASAACLYDFPAHNDTNATSSCDLEYACAPLKGALEYGNLDPSNETEYGYCQAEDNAFYGTGINDCVSCLQSSASTYTANFLLALEAGCQQEPASGTLLSISGSLFSTTAINTTVPSNTTSSSSSSASSTRVLSLTAIVGIAIGLGVLFLLAAGLFILYYCQQRRHALEDARFLRNNPYPSLQDRFYYAHDMSSGGPPSFNAPGQTYALPQYTVDYKPAAAAAEGGEDGNFTNNAEYYDRIEGRSRGRPLQAHPVRLTNDNERSSDVIDSIGNLNASALPTHPAYIPRTAAPGHLGGRASRNASRSASARSTTSSTEPLQPLQQHQRPQSRQSHRGRGTAAGKPTSYAMEVYLDARDEPGPERAPSRAEVPPIRNIQVELAGPPGSSYEQPRQQNQQRPSSLGLTVPPPAVSWRSRRASVSPSRQPRPPSPPPPPPPGRAATSPPTMSALILPSVPKIRMPGKKPPKLRVMEPAEGEHRDGGAGSGGHVGISGPLAFPDGRFSVRPLNNDRIVEQTVERVGVGQIIEVPIGSGKSYLYG